VEIAAHMPIIKRTLSKDIKKADEDNEIIVPKEFNSSISNYKKAFAQKGYIENHQSKVKTKKNIPISHDKSKIIEGLGKEFSCVDPKIEINKLNLEETDG